MGCTAPCVSVLAAANGNAAGGVADAALDEDADCALSAGGAAFSFSVSSVYALDAPPQSAARVSRPPFSIQRNVINFLKTIAVVVFERFCSLCQDDVDECSLTRQKPDFA